MRPAYLDRDFLHQKYVVERLSATEISAQIFSATSTVLKYLKRHGFEVRGSGKNIRPRRHLRFGEKIAGRVTRDHKREQEVIAKMQNLRGRGFSYWKIADILNAMKVPTKTRRGRWHARSVQQVLDAARPSLAASTPE